MKKIIVALLLAGSSITAMADGHFGGYHGGYHGGYQSHYHGGGFNNFIGPAIIGGVIGYAIAQPRETVIYQQPQVIYQQPQVIYQQPGVPVGYHEETLFDGYCRCYRTVLVRN